MHDLIFSLETDLASERLKTGRDTLAANESGPVELVAAVCTGRDEMLVGLQSVELVNERTTDVSWAT
jgi:hypothetical protein